jgi:hypothetical protein
MHTYLAGGCSLQVLSTLTELVDVVGQSRNTRREPQRVRLQFTILEYKNRFRVVVFIN